MAAGWRGRRRAGEEVTLERRRDFLEEAAWVALVVMILEAGVVIGEEADASGNVLDMLTYCCVMWSYGLLHFSKVVVLPSVLSLSIHRESVPGTVQRGSHVML